MTTSDVGARLSSRLAYTSVATVLSRLIDKGFVVRSRTGRPYRFSAATTRDEWNSARMAQVLGESPDHRAVLANFVGRLSKRDVEALRRLLEDDAR